MQIRMAFLACASAATLQAQGYGQAGGSTGGYGGSGSSGGAAIARVAVAPGGLSGGGGGFGGGQGAFAGGMQGLGNAGGGGGLHGVTRRTFMAEPNTLAAQYFSAGGVNLGPAAGLGTAGGGAAYYGAGAPANRQNRRLAMHPAMTRSPQLAVRSPLPPRPGELRPVASGATIAAAHAPEDSPAEPAVSATQMAGVMPAESPPAPAPAPR